jgi:L-alanine-DL-glutamate epimerase-like enolase superfamily enzyme
MVRAMRNIGWRGVCACAISALDVALRDLKARLLGIPRRADEHASGRRHMIRIGWSCHLVLDEPAHRDVLFLA